MLFSPPNEFGNQFLYKLIGYTCLVHVSFLMLFFGIEAWLGSRPIVISLKGMGGKVSMLSRPRVRGRQARKRVPQKSRQRKQPVKKAVPKKVAKKAPVKKKVAKKVVPRKSAKKASVKKKVAKKVVPKKSAKKAPVKKTQPKLMKKELVAAAAPQVVQEKEVDVAQAALSSDAVEREFAKYFTMPAGFDDYEPFTITFEVKEGNVVAISPHTRGPLVVYTAVKDALLHMRMPYKNKKISWRIT